MRKIAKSIGVILVLMLFANCSLAQGVKQPTYDFSLLRQDDQIEIPGERGSFYQQMKYTPLFNDGFISFGGSYRGQYEFFSNEEFSFSPNRENGWYLQRILVHTNIQLNNQLRLFGELGSSFITGKEDLAPVDQDDLYVNQLFFEYRTEDVTLTVGRENLKVGSRRLIDPREGPNIRRGFDHFSLEIRKGHIEYLIFGGSPVVPQNGIFDNLEFQNEEYLWGVYGKKVIANAFNLDAYYLGSHYGSATYGIGTDEELRHSVGIRAWESTGNWQYDNEAIFQFGSFGDKNIIAWTISFHVSNQLNEKNKIGLKTELISGSTSEGTLGTFNPLYPRGAYFGRVARFGPANLIDIHPYWSFTSGKFSMEIDYDVFWRYSKDDAVYGPPMNIVLEGASEERFIAQQIGTIFNYEFSPFAVVELETNFIFPGAHINTVRPGASNLLHMVLTTELRF